MLERLSWKKPLTWFEWLIAAYRSCPVILVHGFCFMLCWWKTALSAVTFPLHAWSSFLRCALSVIFFLPFLGHSKTKSCFLSCFVFSCCFCLGLLLCYPWLPKLNEWRKGLRSLPYRASGLHSLLAFILLLVPLACSKEGLPLFNLVGKAAWIGLSLFSLAFSSMSMCSGPFFAPSLGLGSPSNALSLRYLYMSETQALEYQ